MRNLALQQLRNTVSGVTRCHAVGRVRSVSGHVIEVAGLEDVVRLGDRLRLSRRDGSTLLGEVLTIEADHVRMLPDNVSVQVALSDSVVPLGPALIAPCDDWIGRVVDPYGRPMDGRMLPNGPNALDVNEDPPPALTRKPLGAPLKTGFHLLNTLLPVVTGQRIGVFAGSGVGKTTLVSDLVKSLEADVVVLGLVGERAREIGEFIRDTLGPVGMARTVVIASAADAPPTERFRCPLAAMRVAELFRDQGKHVVLVVDSLTRFAEAHREMALAAGEFPGLRGFPVSTVSKLTKLVERAGTGEVEKGDITAIFSVLVAGSDMNEPVADMLRGVLDGHLVLDRDLAEQGHFPAINPLTSVSRALPKSASPAQNALIARARGLLHLYSKSTALIATGLYQKGADRDLDTAIAFHKLFMAFGTEKATQSVSESFEKLAVMIRSCGASP